MFLSAIGTAGVISAYFFRHITSAYSLNVLDPIEGRLPYYLCVFGCGLVFWLLVLSWAKQVAKLAKLITPITTLNICGCLLAPFMKLPLLVRFLVLFQVSSNLALLLIWAFFSLKYMKQEERIRMQLEEMKRKKRPEEKERLEEMKLKERPEEMKLKEMKRKERPEEMKRKERPEEMKRKERPEEMKLKEMKRKEIINRIIEKAKPEFFQRRVGVHNVDGVGGKVDEAGESGSGHGSGASGSEEIRGRYGGNDGGGGAGGGGDRGESGSGYGSGASGSGENSGGYGDHRRDEGGTGSGHGSGAGGSGENRGGSEGGDRGRDGGEADPESGGRGTNTKQAFGSSKIIEMSLMLTAQTTAALIGFHLTTTSSSSKALLIIVLLDQLVAYLCGLTSILLSSNNPEDSKAAKIFADIGFVCTALGFILMVAMFVPWYLVLIAVLLFGVIWLIFFCNGLKTRATKVCNYLKNSTQSITNCI